MKWIGQNIYDFISRFRNDVYLDSPTAGGSDPDKFLGIDSNGKIIYRTGTQVASDIGAITSETGDISAVTAGVGLSGGGTTGAVTLTVDLSEFSEQSPANGDFLMTLDSDGGTEQLTSVADLASLYAGTGLTASSSVIGVDAAQTQITSIGTIGTGTWQGDVIASAYLDADTAHLSGIQTFTGTKTFTAKTTTFDGDKSVTPGDGAVIHIDTHDVTDTATSASGTAGIYTHVSIEAPRLLATNASVTTTAAATLYIKNAPAASTNQTITNAYALWVDDGAAKFDGAIIGDLTGQADTVATIAGLAPNTATTQATQGNITSCANLVTVGTIGTGVWQGTAVATGYTKHLVHYDFQGYGTGDGTNYEMANNLNDANAPFEHNINIGSDGTTATTVQNVIRSGGKVMPRACTLKRWTGWAAAAGSQTAYVGLFKITPTRDDNTNLSAVLLDEVSYTALGNAKMEDWDETSFTATAIAASDILITAMKSQSGALHYFTSTVEVEF